MVTIGTCLTKYSNRTCQTLIIKRIVTEGTYYHAGVIEEIGIVGAGVAIGGVETCLAW